MPLETFQNQFLLVVEVPPFKFLEKTKAAGTPGEGVTNVAPVVIEEENPEVYVVSTESNAVTFTFA